ncbi:MAG TPA: OmpA family protein [Candidatus Sulfotelmatobacter sp.]|nr:OmpA family protein [Candidatus Sulfotelmatobacter sp.]
MKNRILIAVCLSSALTLPGFAQQGNSDSSTSQAATQSLSTREPLENPTPKGFWDGDDPNLVNLVTHPFATKKYVQRHTQPIRDRINELDELTSENARNIKDIDTRSQQGLQMASEKSNLADQHASDASNKAQLAQTAANDATSKVTNAEQMVNGLDQYKGGGQTEIHFRPGQTVLSKSAKDALDQMATPLKDQRSYIIEVRGFAPGRGQAAIASSQKMADSVVRYLVLTHNIPVYRIYELSMGNAASGETMGAKHGTTARVEVNVLQNNLVSSAQR